LDLLSRKLTARGCSVGWNRLHETWDLKARRGALTEARIRVVIEHHGGPRRLIRLSSIIQPPKSVLWVQGVTATLAGVLGAYGFLAPAVLLATAFVTLSVTLVVHANRLEAAILSIAAEVAEELQGKVKAPPRSVRDPASEDFKAAIAGD